MILAIVFSSIAAAGVWIAGRKNPACDPRLTILTLLLTVAFPWVTLWMPKWFEIPTVSSLNELQQPAWTEITLVLKSVWLCGVIWCATRLMVAQWKLLNWWKESETIDQVGLIEIRQTIQVNGPVAAGVFRKVIFVPADWLEWPEDVRAAVLRHELAHHERCDPLWRWISAIAAALYWFNPLIHWMKARLEIQQELACDEHALRGGIQADRYAGFLCDLASSCSRQRLALAASERGGLETRVRQLMSSNRPSIDPWFVLGLFLSVAAAALILSAVEKNSVSPERRKDAVLRLSADPFPGN
ncbi:M56 family metallopeptidase [Luteolibacter pohnpeiensis]|uniref:M56 family metallopeptidase n=1 Tax=Luteolibacter pohnpeiensis TaxID=454153 RepID=A0A934VVQ7_9BACT|nr:M56 family metallopeptidase [Luteolibacter pohnpeiensis]MBK1882455.1 M56 family metallopeptidase [Luteolibacter pohnpeiensis]